MKTATIALVVFLFTLTCFGQATISATEQERISKFLTSFFEAVKNKDRAVMNSSLHDGFVLISSDSNGEQIKKENYINGVMMPDYLKVNACSLSDFRFMEQGNVIIANFRIHWESQYKGKPWNANFINSDILIRSGDSYKILYRHTSYPASELRRVVEERYN